MCSYNRCRVSKTEYIRLMGIEKEIKNLRLNRPVQNGFDYRDWPVIKPLSNGKDFEIKEIHWEYIPESIHSVAGLRQARIMYTWLNARSETLLSSMYREGAYRGRCLVLSSGFYEWRHEQKIGKRGKPVKEKYKIPFFITLKDNPEYFFMAGVSREWENTEMQQSADTFAIVTTEANELMQFVHNEKKRMPTILPEHLAKEWIQPGLSKERIKEIASYHYPSEEMTAWTIEKNFLTKTGDPAEEFIYTDYPDIYTYLNERRNF